MWYGRRWVRSRKNGGVLGRNDEKPTRLPVKNRLKSLRADRKISQDALADELGVSRQTVNAVETGRHDPSLSLAFALARAFHLRIEDVFTPTSSEVGPPGAPAKRSRATRRPPR